MNRRALRLADMNRRALPWLLTRTVAPPCSFRRKQLSTEDAIAIFHLRPKLGNGEFVHRRGGIAYRRAYAPPPPVLWVM